MGLESLLTSHLSVSSFAYRKSPLFWESQLTADFRQLPATRTSGALTRQKSSWVTDEDQLIVWVSSWSPLSTVHQIISWVSRATIPCCKELRSTRCWYLEIGLSCSLPGDFDERAFLFIFKSSFIAISTKLVWVAILNRLSGKPWWFVVCIFVVFIYK